MSSQRRLETLRGHLKGGDVQAKPPSTGEGPLYRYTRENPLLTPEQRAFYEEHGYLVVKGLVPQGLLDTFRERFQKICKKEVKVTPSSPNNVMPYYGFPHTPTHRTHTRPPHTPSAHTHRTHTHRTHTHPLHAHLCMHTQRTHPPHAHLLHTHPSHIHPPHTNQPTHTHTQVPGLVVMKDVAIAKRELHEDETVVTKIQDFQVWVCVCLEGTGKSLPSCVAVDYVIG